MSEGAAAARKEDEQEQSSGRQVVEGHGTNVPRIAAPGSDQDMPKLLPVEGTRDAAPAAWTSPFAGHHNTHANRAHQVPLKYKFHCSSEVSEDGSPKAKRPKKVHQEGVYVPATVPARHAAVSPRPIPDSKLSPASRMEPLQSAGTSSSGAVTETKPTASTAVTTTSTPATTTTQRIVERRRLPQSLTQSLYLPPEAVRSQAPSHDASVPHAISMPGMLPGHEIEGSMMVAGGAVPYLLPISIGGSTVYSVVYLPPPGQWPGSVPMVAAGAGPVPMVTAGAGPVPMVTAGAPVPGVRDQPVAAAMPAPVAGQYPMVVVGGGVAAHAYQPLDAGAAIPGAGTMAMVAPSAYPGIAMTMQGSVGQPVAVGPQGTLVQLPGAVQPPAMQPWIQPTGHVQEQTRHQHEDQKAHERSDQDYHHDNRSQGSYEQRHVDQLHADSSQHLSVGTVRSYTNKQSSHINKGAEGRPLASSCERGPGLYMVSRGCLLVHTGLVSKASSQSGWHMVVDAPSNCTSLACIGTTVVCLAQRKLWTLQGKTWITCMQAEDVTAICAQDGSVELLACCREQLLAKHWKPSDQDDGWQIICDCPSFVSMAQYKSVVFGISGRHLLFADIRKAKTMAVGWQKTLQSRHMCPVVVAVLGDTIYVVADDDMLYSASLRDWPLESMALTAVCVLNWHVVCAAAPAIALAGGIVGIAFPPLSATAPPKLSETPLSPVRPAASGVSSNAGDSHRDHESLYLFTESAGLWRMTERNGVFGYVCQLPWKPTALAFLAGRAYAASQRCLYTASLQPNSSGSGATLSSWSQVGETPFLTAMVSHKGCLFGLGEQLLWRRDDMSVNGGWVAIGRAPDSTAIASASGNLFIASSNKLYCQPPNNNNQVVAAWHEVGPASQVWSMTAAGGYLYSLCGNVLWSAPVNASPNHKHVWSRYCSTQSVAGLAAGPADVAVTASSEPVAAVTSDGTQTQPDSTTGPSSDKDSMKASRLSSKARDTQTRR